MLDDCKIRLAGLLSIGAGFLFQLGFGIQKVDDFFTQLAGLIDQTEVGGIADRLFDYGRIQNQLALMGRY